MQVARFSNSVSVVARALLCMHLAPTKPTKPSLHRPLFVLSLLSAVLLTFTTVGANAQFGPPTPEYTTVVVFGDSLSDTGNVAHLAYDKYGLRIPGPVADYTNGSFTNGYDTVPAARQYVGVWIEQLAESMPSKPEVKNSLDGGTNYAYGFATTGSGTGVFTFGPSNSLSVDVVNIGQQITEYLATHPKITPKTLFVVWGGANDLIHATSPDDLINAGINQTLNIQRLIGAGATQFIVPNLPPLGLIPRLNGNAAASAAATVASAYYNMVLSNGIQSLRDSYSGNHLHIVQLDIFALFNQIVAAPSTFSLSNVTTSSQGVSSADPDSYLFWDDLHPTTHGHNIVAINAAAMLARSNCQNASAEGKGPVGVGSDACAGLTTGFVGAQ
jgi:phospholipase/lecithinase/hemolysin